MSFKIECRPVTKQDVDRHREEMEGERMMSKNIIRAIIGLTVAAIGYVHILPLVTGNWFLVAILGAIVTGGLYLFFRYGTGIGAKGGPTEGLNGLGGKNDKE